MATMRERVMDYLSRRPDGASGEDIAREIGLDEATADAQCRLLAEEGLVERRGVGRALLNLLRSDCE